MVKLEQNAYKKLTSLNIIAPLQAGSALSEVFHENTKMGPLTGAIYHRHITSLTQSALLRDVLKQPCKIYSLNEAVAMGRPVTTNALEANITNRRSARRFSDEPMTLESLSRLLHYSYGVTDRRSGFRAVPSAGALYPLELYVIPQNVAGLETGLYHYNVNAHSLDTVNHEDVWPRLQEIVGFQGTDVNSIAVVVVVTAIFRRLTLKYLDRGYRMVLFEVGAVAQNLALVGNALGMGSCALGGFQDDNLASLLGIDGIDEAPLLPIILGTNIDAPTHPIDDTESDW